MLEARSTARGSLLTASTLADTDVESCGCSNAGVTSVDDTVTIGLEAGGTEKAVAKAPPATLPKAVAAMGPVDPDADAGADVAVADEGWSDLAAAPSAVNGPAPRLADGLVARGGPRLKPLAGGSPCCSGDSYGLDKGDLAGV